MPSLNWCVLIHSHIRLQKFLRYFIRLLQAMDSSSISKIKPFKSLIDVSLLAFFNWIRIFHNIFNLLAIMSIDVTCDTYLKYVHHHIVKSKHAKSKLSIRLHDNYCSIFENPKGMTGIKLIKPNRQSHLLPTAMVKIFLIVTKYTSFSLFG